MRFANKVAVVTGAGQGMGRAIARRLVREGARVVAVDVKEAKARETIDQAGGDAAGLARVCNIADSTAVKALFAEVDARFDGSTRWSTTPASVEPGATVIPG